MFPDVDVHKSVCPQMYTTYQFLGVFQLTSMPPGKAMTKKCMEQHLETSFEFKNPFLYL